ncbi:MAG: exodeoxyribonuclease V subunit beta, partial [Candidatus Electrothrix sp. AR3]|nr:exodeoxyribonuclease V subunit beta [Candidatus Electrothrix sp. AR3]
HGQESVFSSQEAGQLRLLMTCLNDLADNALVRTVLAGELFGFHAAEIEHLRKDEQAWEEVMAFMSNYRQLWQAQGFLPMFQRLLKEQQVVGRLNASLSGERALTNFLHLAELLQEAGRQRIGTNALLRWFIDQIHFPEEQAENQQLRLESDENLVKIVTIHKAKGMEYPLVFLPFLWSGRPLSPKAPPAFHRPEEPERLSIDFGTEQLAEHFQLAERERLAEDLRLLYVALTRARYGCFFSWGQISKMEQSALCYLLHQEGLSFGQIVADLEQADLEIIPYPEHFSRPDLRSQEQEASLVAARFQGRVNSNWQITSYSNLTVHKDSRPEQPDYDQAVFEVEQAPGQNVFGFPKGAAAGTCLHAILELIDFQEPDNHAEIILSQLARAGFAESWLPVVNDWMEAILTTRLQSKDGLFSLSDLTEAERVNEMSFYFPLESMSLRRFNRVLQDFDYAPLPERQKKLQGLMVGFIDLVFSYQGRYYLADYKSNHLGNQEAAYQPDQLHLAMLDHRYDLQYLIYTLALHRFLRGRIQDYAYTTHFGGAFYLFLR